MKKRKVTKTRKIKTVTLTPDTALRVVVPPEVVPSVIVDPATREINLIPIPADKLAEPGWFKRWFG